MTDDEYEIARTWGSAVAAAVNAPPPPNLDHELAAIRAARAGLPEPPPPKVRPSRAKRIRSRASDRVTSLQPRSRLHVEPDARRSPLKALAGRYNALRARRGEDDPGTQAARLTWRQAAALDALEQWVERELSDDESAAILAVLWPPDDPGNG